MDCDIMDLMRAGRWEDAKKQYLKDGAEYFDGEADVVRHLNVSDVIQGRSGDYRYLVATMVHVKVGRQVWNGGNGTKGAKKAERPYDRLFLFRELLAGDMFAVVTQHPSESKALMCALDVPLMGTTFMLLDVVFLQQYFTGLPRVVLKYPLLPIEMALDGYDIQKFLPERRLVARYYPLYGEVTDLTYTACSVSPVCGSMACDGSHTTDRRLCFSLEMPARPARSLTLTLSSRQLDIAGVEYTSRSLASVFMTEAYMQSLTQAPTMLAVRKAVKKQFEFYRQANVPWIVIGWSKVVSGQSSFTSATDETLAKGSKIHLAYVRPARLLPNAPLLGVTEPKRAADVVLGRALSDRFYAPPVVTPTGLDAGNTSSAGGARV